MESPVLGESLAKVQSSGFKDTINMSVDGFVKENKDLFHQDNKNNNKDQFNRNLLLQQEVLMSVSETSKEKIDHILEEVNGLCHIEKLLLYLKLPTGDPSHKVLDPLRQSLNPLGSRCEINQTINWIQTHLEEDRELSLQKKGVYDDYVSFCEPNGIKPLSTADFGKVMKQVYPNVRPRRLGTRGQSKYCYSGLRSRIKLPSPLLPELSSFQDRPNNMMGVVMQHSQHQDRNICSSSNSNEVLDAACFIVKEWAESKLAVSFGNIISLAFYLVKDLSVGVGSDAAMVLATKSTDNLDESLCFGYQNKHKEMTVQLQRKLENNQTKRKQNQSAKNEPKTPRAKKQRNTTLLCQSTKTSPRPDLSPLICDSATLQQLPDFNSFQRPVNVPTTAHPKSKSLISDQQLRQNLLDEQRTNKPLSKQQARKNKGGKYKTIQSKQGSNNNNKDHNSDLESFLKQQILPVTPNMEDDLDRSQDKVNNNTNSSNNNNNNNISNNKVTRINKKIPESASQFLLNDESTTYFSRERLESICQVEKDALDEYLGASTSSSHDQEEEIMQYLSDTNEDEKLLQLRQILAQNTISYGMSSNITEGKNRSIAAKSSMARELNLTASKRRVSFERGPFEDAANSKFIPIGRLSPSSVLESSNASPFVSPRSTPVCRTKSSSLLSLMNSRQHHSHSLLKNDPLNKNCSPKSNNPLNKSGFPLNKSKGHKLKPNLELSLDVRSRGSTFEPVSEPCSPHLSRNRFNYKHAKKLQQQPFDNNLLSEPSTPELRHLVNSDLELGISQNFRSQSVPLKVEHCNNPYQTFSFRENDLMNISETITGYPSLDFEDSEILNKNHVLNQQYSPPVVANPNDIFPNACSSNLKLPSRSVPTTPFPYQAPPHLVSSLEAGPSTQPPSLASISKSYPSTPVTLSQTFTYNQGHDYLLNGQPIRNKASQGQTFDGCDNGTQRHVEVEPTYFAASYVEPAELIDAKNFDFDDASSSLAIDERALANKQVQLSNGNNSNVDMF